MSSSEDLYQIAYFPYLALSRNEELHFGKLCVWSTSLLESKTEPGPLRDQVTALLRIHRVPSANPAKASPLRGIGVVSRGAVQFGQLVPRWTVELQELRCALFLACLSDNLNLHGPNAGSYLYTAENFTFISNSFSLSNTHISESVGEIVRLNVSGYRIGEVQFPTPTYVPRPITFRHDKELFAAINRLRSVERKLYRRVMDASALFLESYYNSPLVDKRARLLLEAAAFEVLLDLPDSQERKFFKDRIEQYCVDGSERRYRHKYETRRGKKPESRTQKGIWADRFYTLRNHIIHGERVPDSEFLFRGTQHHLAAAPVFFVHVLKRIIEIAFENAGERLKFYNVIEWHDGNEPLDADDPDGTDEQPGFRCGTNPEAFLMDELARAGH